MNITVYDGAESIGGNKIYVEENGRGVFLDFGMNFARYGEYYAEFLSDRSTRGITIRFTLALYPSSTSTAPISSLQTLICLDTPN